MFQTQAPRPRTAHAKAGEIYSIGIDSVLCLDFVQQPKKDRIVRIVPPLFGRALRRDDDEWKIMPFLHKFWRAIPRHFENVAATLARSMQKKHQWPAGVRVCLIPSGEMQQVFDLVRARTPGN